MIISTLSVAAQQPIFQPICTNIADGAIIYEDAVGTWWYAMCYNGEALQQIGGGIWYEAADDLLSFIQGADYDFDVSIHEDLVSLGRFSNYGNVYEHMMDEEVQAVTATFRGEYIDVQKSIKNGDTISVNTEEVQKGERSLSYTTYILLSVILLLIVAGISIAFNSNKSEKNS